MSRGRYGRTDVGAENEGKDGKNKPTSRILSSCVGDKAAFLALSGDPEPSSLISLILDLLPSWDRPLADRLGKRTPRRGFVMAVVFSDQQEGEAVEFEPLAGKTMATATVETTGSDTPTPREEDARCKARCSVGRYATARPFSLDWQTAAELEEEIIVYVRVWKRADERRRGRGRLQVGARAATGLVEVR